MGWLGYGLYSGDETQTQHIYFIKTALPSVSRDEIFEWLKYRKTSIPKKHHIAFRKGIPNILKKVKPPKNILNWNEDKAIEWQMLLSLFTDNNMKVPHIVLVNGMLACHYLLNGEHARDFNEPSKRRAAIRRFMKKVDEWFCSVRARKEISRKLGR